MNINPHQPSSTLINPHQPSSTLINPHQPSSTLINPHQPSSTLINLFVQLFINQVVSSHTSTNFVHLLLIK